ncbi:carbon storage regulator [Bradyrhizobium sp. Arg68]|uniref:carbon storage regulator n=1 Tax=Bradyrhizobium ivorense TaxID=2511166 RepID=UPI001E4A1D24|nr:carbon storage regulator [Bradyrhizobium ivorense]MCC8940513.1 carbon storage regulator [Bradyrhizobium ivorense]
MLELTRHIGERVLIGHGIVVEVLAVNGTQVRLGFVAPEDLDVYREEIYRRIYGELRIAPHLLERRSNGNRAGGRR